MFLEDYNRVLCNEKVEETLMHLFWDCAFAEECQNLILPIEQWGISCYDEICLSMYEFPPDIALGIILMGCWGIWSIRNDKIFRQAGAHIPSWLSCVNQS